MASDAGFDAARNAAAPRTVPGSASEAAAASSDRRYSRVAPSGFSAPIQPSPARAKAPPADQVRRGPWSPPQVDRPGARPLASGGPVAAKLAAAARAAPATDATGRAVAHGQEGHAGDPRHRLTRWCLRHRRRRSRTQLLTDAADVTHEAAPARCGLGIGGHRARHPQAAGQHAHHDCSGGAAVSARIARTAPLASIRPHRVGFAMSLSQCLTSRLTARRVSMHRPPFHLSGAHGVRGSPWPPRAFAKDHDPLSESPMRSGSRLARRARCRAFGICGTSRRECGRCPYLLREEHSAAGSLTLCFNDPPPSSLLGHSARIRGCVFADRCRMYRVIRSSLPQALGEPELSAAVEVPLRQVPHRLRVVLPRDCHQERRDESWLHLSQRAVVADVLGVGLPRPIMRPCRRPTHMQTSRVCCDR